MDEFLPNEFVLFLFPVYIADTGELMEKDETTYEFFKSKDYPYDYITAVRSQKSASVSHIICLLLGIEYLCP